jgi:hypothetical protein
LLKVIYFIWFDDYSYTPFYFIDAMEFIVYPANDFLIAMGFTAIYYYQGKDEEEQRWKQYLKLNTAINDVSDERTFSEIEQMLTDEAK